MNLWRCINPVIDCTHHQSDTTRRPIITQYLHNISGEGDGWATGQWYWHLHEWIPTKQPKIRPWID